MRNRQTRYLEQTPELKESIEPFERRWTQSQLYVFDPDLIMFGFELKGLMFRETTKYATASGFRESELFCSVRSRMLRYEKVIAVPLCLHWMPIVGLILRERDLPWNWLGLLQTNIRIDFRPPNAQTAITPRNIG